MSPIRITAAGERLVEPIIALAHCSKLARIIVTGANSAEAVIDLHRLGYARATTTSNCGLPAGQYDVVLLDGLQRSIKAVGTTLDWVADFLSLTGVLIVWLDPHQPAAGRAIARCWKATAFGSRPAPCMNEALPLRRDAVTRALCPRSREVSDVCWRRRTYWIEPSRDRSWTMWHVSTLLACRTRSRLRGCEGERRCGRCLADHNGKSSGQVPARSALYARPRSEVPREARSSLHTNLG